MHEWRDAAFLIINADTDGQVDIMPTAHQVAHQIYFAVVEEGVHEGVAEVRALNHHGFHMESFVQHSSQHSVQTCTCML